MKERLQLVSLFDTGKYAVAELASYFKVSRKTAYKWISRYAEAGVSGLEEHSRAPHRHPNATPEPMVMEVLRAKAAHPTWGPAKLQPGAEAPIEVTEAWPAISTRGVILNRHGLVRTRRRKRRVPPWSQPFQHCVNPNCVWCADFKGWVRTGDGSRCDPLTISDAYSRMLLCCEILPKPDYAHVRPVFERIFREYGLPLAIRTDNGPPFASVGVGGLSHLSVWWVKLGIVPERIQPGHPEQNGRHERLHRTLKQETMSPPAPNSEAQQQSCDKFRVEYNTLRPHQALGQIPPAAVYKYSPRMYPDQIEGPEYPSLTEIRRVRSNGQIKWHGELVFVSEALVGEQVGIREEKDSWMVFFGPIPLGVLRPKKKALEHLPSVLLNSQQAGEVVTDVLS